MFDQFMSFWFIFLCFIFSNGEEESMSSVSSIVDADSSDDDVTMHFSVSENQSSNLDLHHQISDYVFIPRDTPRTRAVPFMSPTPESPRPISPPDLSHTSPLNNPINRTRTSPPLLVAANIGDHLEWVKSIKNVVHYNIK